MGWLLIRWYLMAGATGRSLRTRIELTFTLAEVAYVALVGEDGLVICTYSRRLMRACRVAETERWWGFETHHRIDDW